MHLLSFPTLLLLLALLLSPLSRAAELKLPELPDAGALIAPTETQLGTLPAGIGLPVGSSLPAFRITHHDGKPVSSADLLKQVSPDGNLLIVFYRGGWCPYCNLQIRQLTDAWPQFQQRKVLPVLISADRVDASALSQRQYTIPFPVLSDPDLRAHDAFKVSMQLDDKTYLLYKTYGIDVEQWSDREHHKFAVASVFLLGADGRIRWAHAALDYTQRPSVSQLLMVIDQQAR
ncbi:MAG: peroxiredoxin family protein [Pseudomonadota bacterium]